MFNWLFVFLLVASSGGYKLPQWLLEGAQEPAWRPWNSSSPSIATNPSYALRKPVVKYYKAGMPCVCSYSGTDSYSEIVYRAVHVQQFALLNGLTDYEKHRRRWFILLPNAAHSALFDPYLTPIESFLCMDVDSINEEGIAITALPYNRNDTAMEEIGLGTYVSILFEGERALIPKAIHSLAAMPSPLISVRPDFRRAIMEELSPKLLSEEGFVPLPWIHLRTRSVLWVPIIA
eukprot:Protomagalhaensia_sp_Gyna_25__2532@NODE_242_length_4215_cov_69_629550_g187_i0_p3_GENE_NODE_242_length_4215_cov_69_629550_g187_i0NODE_242_length_4215_cov_69_629550_g187_i0_p3_ORF_typecomplete_len233_score36_56_NODE_242_length_4215_cov_69_629550_g187_i027693467